MKEEEKELGEHIDQKVVHGQWMEELAAMKALSPQELPYAGMPEIILAYENAALSQSKSLNPQSSAAPTGSVVPNGSSDMSSDTSASPSNSALQKFYSVICEKRRCSSKDFACEKLFNFA